MVENPESASPAERANCIHRWLIEPQAGPTAQGTCKKCGLTRADFINAMDDGVSNNMDRERSGPDLLDPEASLL